MFKKRETPPPAPDTGQPVSLLTPPSTSSGEGASPATPLGEENSPTTSPGEKYCPQPPTELAPSAYDTAITPSKSPPTQALLQGSRATPEPPQDLEWKPYVPPQRKRPFVTHGDGGRFVVREQKVPPWRRPAQPAYPAYPIYSASSANYREDPIQSDGGSWKPSQSMGRGVNGGGPGLHGNPRRHSNENPAVWSGSRGRGRERAMGGMRGGYGAGAAGRGGGLENKPPCAPALKTLDEGTSRHRTRSRSRGRQPEPVPEPPRIYKSDADRSSHHPDGHGSSRKHTSGMERGARERHRSQSSDRFSEKESEHYLGRHGSSRKHKSGRERSARERNRSQSSDRYSEESEHHAERHHRRHHRNRSHTRKGSHHRGNSHHRDSPRKDSGHHGDSRRRGSSRHRSASHYSDSRRKKSHRQRSRSHHRSSSHGEDPHHKKSQRRHRSHRHRSHSRHRSRSRHHETSRHRSRDRSHRRRHRSSHHSRHDKAPSTKRRHRHQSPADDTTPARKRRKTSPTTYTDDEKGGQQEGAGKPCTRPHRQ